MFSSIQLGRGVLLTLFYGRLPWFTHAEILRDVFLESSILSHNVSVFTEEIHCYLPAPAPPENGSTALWNLYFPFESLLNNLFYIQLWEWMVCSMLKFTTLCCVFSLEYGYFSQTAEGRIKYRLTVKDIQNGEWRLLKGLPPLPLSLP